MKLYRAMCKEEFQSMLQINRLSWNSKFKWFGTIDFVNSRVLDGKFNNSNFVHDRYAHLIEIDFDDSTMSQFSKCGHNEFMLNVRKVPLVKINSWKSI